MKLRHHALGACALALVSACRPPMRPLPRVSSAPVPSTATGAADDEPKTVVSAAPAPKPIPRLDRLTDAVCDVPAPRWSGKLLLRSGGPAYASVSLGPATIGLGGAAHDGVSRAVVESAGLRVVGVVDRPSVFLAKPTLLSQLVMPLAQTSVTWHETTTAEHVLVSLDVSDVFTAPEVVEAAVPCKALVGTEPDYDARGVIGPKALREVSLESEATFVRSIGAPGGARIKRSGRMIDLIGSRGDMSRIVVTTSRYVAVGWVPSTTIGRAHWARPPRVRMGAAHRGGRGDRTCRHEIPLIATVEGEQAFIGTLPPGASFKTSALDVAPGFFDIELFESWFSPMDGAKILVRAADLTDC